MEKPVSVVALVTLLVGWCAGYGLGVHTGKKETWERARKWARVQAVNLALDQEASDRRVWEIRLKGCRP